MGDTTAEKDFQALQRQFAAHIRNPQATPVADIEDRRLKIYRDLFFNNVNNFTRSAFPVAHSIMPQQWWNQAVRDFLTHYRCESPYFSDISRHFLEFITNAYRPTGAEPDFLVELMHYEWVELALDVSEADPFGDDLEQLGGDLLDVHPVQSPLAWLLSYRYPVHRISAAQQPTAPSAQPNWLLVYRDRKDKVQFMELNVVTARLLSVLSEDPEIAGGAALHQIAREMGYPQENALIEPGLQILQQLCQVGVLIGARRA